MRITKEIVEDFIDTVPLEIHYYNGKISFVSVHWDYSRDTDEEYGRKNVDKILSLLETDKKYQSLLDE